MSKKTKEPLPKKTIYAHLLDGECQAVEGFMPATVDIVGRLGSVPAVPYVDITAAVEVEADAATFFNDPTIRHDLFSFALFGDDLIPYSALPTGLLQYPSGLPYF